MLCREFVNFMCSVLQSSCNALIIKAKGADLYGNYQCQYSDGFRPEGAGRTIKPEAVDPDDIEMLEDMVAAAINATVKQVDETAEAEMGKLTGGLNIQGL